MKPNEIGSIRPSQVTRTFGPGSIYDNQRDSVIIMGLDFWKREKFKIITDELLLQEIRRSKFDTVEALVSTSSSEDPDNPGTVPVRTFPTWGFCPKCNKLVPGRNNKTGANMVCNSMECKERERNDDKFKLPKTYPVRFVMACKNGHLDEFPWYEWVHQNQKEKDACGRDDAMLYLVGNPSSISLEGSAVECRNSKCDARKQEMRFALTKNALKRITFGCTKRRPWLNHDERSCTDIEGEQEQMRGVFKGSTSMYFPLVRSAVTIPPFSSALAEAIDRNREDIAKFRKKKYFKDWLKDKFPNADWTVDEAIEMIERIEDFAKKNKDRDIRELEFKELNDVSKKGINDKEFVAENSDDVPVRYADYIDKIVLVKKTRVVSAITGFTRMDAYDPAEHAKVSALTKDNLTWLPAVENRGEGIFLSFKNSALNGWKQRGEVKERFGKIMTVQKKIKTDTKDWKHSPKYVFLHTFSHAVMKSMARLAGYSIASFTERIYCSDSMAGIFIYTSSASSDGSLGGLVDIARKGESKIGYVLDNAVHASASCSCDPLCSMQEPEEKQGYVGAACHACELLPETCCENMNMLLDRGMIYRTLRDDIGFFDG